MKSKTILVIEEDFNIRELIKSYLHKEGYEVIEAENGKEGKELFLKYDPCFVILDLILPFITGEEVCKWIRKDLKSNVPIIIVTGKIDEQDKIGGLKLGADDYMTKPFSPRELVIRVETVLRRTADRCQKISVNGLVLKPQKGEVAFEGTVIKATAFEYKILHLFMIHPGQVLTRRQMLDALYTNNERHVTERTIDVHVRHLRKKINECTKKDMIETVRGIGYKFVIV
ncbi:DNA-binding response regulator [Falsibacillus albus]|uniref:DNA-binding response regulator n=1 Tax=Falsibacillus albus TaxID=2478915 RepID=A0A3L7K256_9BACI|nr:DNA-binding response regulator [Falsibacillus albus]